MYTLGQLVTCQQRLIDLHTKITNTISKCDAAIKLG